MALAIFDLDNTLISGDSDVLWGQFLSEHGYVDGDLHERQHQRFYDDYVNGNLDIFEFLEFQLHFLTRHSTEDLLAIRRRYIDEKVRPLLLPKAEQLVDSHRKQGHRLMIITATNRFLTEPIADLLAIKELIATEPEVIDGRYSGKVDGVPSFGEGKVVRLREWLAARGEGLAQSWFYTDSHNDLPLLKQVTYPNAVDPDPSLEEEARRRNWPIMSLR